MNAALLIVQQITLIWFVGFLVTNALICTRPNVAFERDDIEARRKEVPYIILWSILWPLFWLIILGFFIDYHYRRNYHERRLNTAELFSLHSRGM